MERRWNTGDQVIVREVWRGEVWSARPMIVVQDTPVLLALYIPEGTFWKRTTAPDGGRVKVHQRLLAAKRQLVDTPWLQVNMLRLVRPGQPYSVLLWWSKNHTVFEGWYINLEEPLRRTRLGFDYMDQLLDVVISPDSSNWHWKDEDEFKEAIDLGLISPRRASELKAEGEKAVKLVMSRKPPFDRDWERWSPNPSWPTPVLKDGWQIV